ncbi:MAG TPA: hypothetical protein VIL24_05005 [Clostridia bacterium]
MAFGSTARKALDIISKILAFLVILVLAVSYINAQFHFLDSVPIVLTIFNYIQTYAVIGVVAIVGLEFVIDKGIILTIIYLALVAVVVIFSFLPNVQNQLLDLIKK